MEESFEYLRRSQRWATVVPVLLTVVLGGIGFFQVRSLVEALAWVDHTDQVISMANDTRRRVIDLETGLRGYLITGDPSFKKPYDDAVENLGKQYGELRRLVSDNAGQTTRVAEIEAKDAEWRKYAKFQMDLRDSGGDFASEARSKRGKNTIGRLGGRGPREGLAEEGQLKRGYARSSF